MPRKPPGRATRTGASPRCTPILDQHEVSQRSALLAILRDALDERGARSVLTRNHRLVLRYNQSPCEPSGPTDPQLRVLASAGPAQVITTDGTTYRLAGDAQWPVSDPRTAAAALIASESSQVRDLS
jgi:hypothetical protein